jgi:small subunit ribosomal protein S7
MPRKGPAPRRELVADPIYRSVLVTQLVNKVMLHGKRSIAEKIVYDAMETIARRRPATTRSTPSSAPSTT